MNDDNLNKIKTLIYDLGWGYTLPYPFLFKRKEITISTELVKDLHIDGDDADAFLIAFGKEFNVDVSQFRIGDYFGDEGDVILPAFIRFLIGSKRANRKVLTVGDLEKAVIAGSLN